MIEISWLNGARFELILSSTVSVSEMVLSFFTSLFSESDLSEA